MSTENSPVSRTARVRIPFWAQVLIGLAAGALLGWLARAAHLGWLTTTLTTIGSIFVTLLKAVVVPLVLTALVVSIVNLRKVANAAKLAVQTLLWFAITAAIAVTIGWPSGSSPIPVGMPISRRPGQRRSAPAAVGWTS